MNNDVFESPISRHIWKTKYQYRDDRHVYDVTVEDTWRRVARSLATVEPHVPECWEQRFYHVLKGFKFLPGGRILAGAGTRRSVTLFNCFVMGLIEDSMDGIFDALKEGALTMQHGGGVGYDFSTLRPTGSRTRSAGGIASGPVSFMRIWDSMCATLLSTGARRGAMMATLRCDHPEIERFIDAKRDPRELRNFNLSVLVSDEFMQAVRTGQDWPLVFPARDIASPDYPDGDGRQLQRTWSGTNTPVPCRVFRVVPARALWERIMRATYDCAEPGVLFIDRINKDNNLWYRESMSATNPCGEIPLPPYGACDLGSVNLTQFVTARFEPEARIDRRGIEATVKVAVRMLDNVIDLSEFPVPEQRRQARGSRRIGLGITGLGDALIMLGLNYGDAAAREFAASMMELVCHSAYRASIELAREKGAFPFFEKDPYLEGRFIQALPEQIRAGIAEMGLRNSHLMAIAPTGTISLLADNVSSGVEPVFAFHYRRRVLSEDGGYVHHDVDDYAWRHWRELDRDDARAVPFIDARRLPPLAHLRMQAAIQPYVDNAISKTINVPADFDFASFGSVYDQAYDLGLKGCTTFRPNSVTGEILSVDTEVENASHCCDIEREAD